MVGMVVVVLAATGVLFAIGPWNAGVLLLIVLLAYVPYIPLGLIAFAFTWFLVPETTGKSLEQIETYWEQGRTWSDQLQPAEPGSSRSA
jgi:hypothetical protein